VALCGAGRKPMHLRCKAEQLSIQLTCTRPVNFFRSFMKWNDAKVPACITDWTAANATSRRPNEAFESIHCWHHVVFFWALGMALVSAMSCACTAAPGRYTSIRVAYISLCILSMEI